MANSKNHKKSSNPLKNSKFSQQNNYSIFSLFSVKCKRLCLCKNNLNFPANDIHLSMSSIKHFKTYFCVNFGVFWNFLNTNEINSSELSSVWVWNKISFGHFSAYNTCKQQQPKIRDIYFIFFWRIGKFLEYCSSFWRHIW